MAVLQVRNCPEYLYDAIAARAQAQYRTIPQETLSLLTLGIQIAADSAGRIEADKKRRRGVLDEIQAHPVTIHGKFPDIAKLVREDRDR
jgi:plasmid stability protein